MSAYQEWKKKLGDTRPWDVVNPNIEKTTDEEAERRFSICRECPSLLSVTNQCRECGCFMKLKVKIKEAVCPLEKW
jgi:hypothetical protein